MQQQALSLLGHLISIVRGAQACMALELLYAGNCLSHLCVTSASHTSCFRVCVMPCRRQSLEVGRQRQRLDLHLPQLGLLSYLWVLPCQPLTQQVRSVLLWLITDFEPCIMCVHISNNTLSVGYSLLQVVSAHCLLSHSAIPRVMIVLVTS